MRTETDFTDGSCCCSGSGSGSGSQCPCPGDEIYCFRIGNWLVKTLSPYTPGLPLPGQIVRVFPVSGGLLGPGCLYENYAFTGYRASLIPFSSVSVAYESTSPGSPISAQYAIDPLTWTCAHGGVATLVPGSETHSYDWQETIVIRRGEHCCDNNGTSVIGSGSGTDCDLGACNKNPDDVFCVVIAGTTGTTPSNHDTPNGKYVLFNTTLGGPSGGFEWDSGQGTAPFFAPFRVGFNVQEDCVAILAVTSVLEQFYSAYYQCLSYHPNNASNEFTFVTDYGGVIGNWPGTLIVRKGQHACDHTTGTGSIGSGTGSGTIPDCSPCPCDPDGITVTVPEHVTEHGVTVAAATAFLTEDFPPGSCAFSGVSDGPAETVVTLRIRGFDCQVDVSFDDNDAETSAIYSGGAQPGECGATLLHSNPGSPRGTWPLFYTF